MFGDNKSVVTSSTVPHSLLSKRHNALAYHQVREAVAAKIVIFNWINSNKNLADLLSKHWDYASVHPVIVKLLEKRGEIQLLEPDPDPDPDPKAESPETTRGE